MSKTMNRELVLKTAASSEQTFERPLVMTYVGGSQPYVWIGDSRGWCFATVDLHDLQAFLDDSDETADPE